MDPTVGRVPRALTWRTTGSGTWSWPASAKSVNLVIHPNDLSHLGEALERWRAEGEQTYQVLRESLRAMGKA